MNEAVNRINNGEEPETVLHWLLTETGRSIQSVSQQMRFAAKTRPNWGDVCARLFVRKKRIRARKEKAPKHPRPECVPRPRGRPITDTPYKVQRRGAIVDALSSHASGLTTTALLKVAGCTERILRNDLTAMAEKGILVHSDFCKGRPTIWRLAK